MTDAATAETYGIDPHIYQRRWWILVVLCTSLVVVIVGNTSLNVAIPTLARDLKASTSGLQWMVDGYGLIFAGMLFTAGALGDRFGRKGALQIGLTILLAGCIVSALASGTGQVIVGRGIMGFGAAFVMPSTLSILANAFPRHERPKAIAIWAGLSGAGGAIGPVVSGFLLRHFWWGSVFLVNVPIIVVSLIAGFLILPTSRDPEQGRLDPVGAVLSIGGISALVYALIEAPSSGWLGARTLVWFGVAALLIALFIVWEHTSRHPMLEMAWFRDPRFSVSSAGILLNFFAMFGVFFLLTQYFQLVLGYDPFQAGVRQLPFAIVMVAIAPRSPKLVERFGANRVVAFGLLIAASGLLLTHTFAIDSSYVSLLPMILVLPAGMALTISPLTASIMAAVPMNHAGVGSAMNDTTRELGGALGVAALGSIVASRYATALAPTIAGLPADVRRVVDDGLAQALKVAGNPANPMPQLAPAAKQAFVDGVALAGTVAAVVAAVASAVVLKLLPRLGAHAELPVTVEAAPLGDPEPGFAD